MHSIHTVSVAVMVAASMVVSSGEWIFSWPYNADGSCSCLNSPVGSYQNFTTQAECLEAFAATDVEYCVHDQRGITEEQCSSAVSIAEGQLNGECASMCTALVARVISLPTFLEKCKFEFVIPFDDSVAVLPDSCFGNYVYGYSDYDMTNLMQAQPFRIFPEVPTPAKCQELCQQTPDCVYFSWRAIPDSVSDVDSFQNFPETCILYDDTYMRQVFSVDVNDLTGKSAYCNADMLGACRVKPWEQTEVFPLFSDYNCLSCDCDTKCAWLSGSHITGPAFCTSPTGRDECSYARPSWTSTLPPCEDTTTTEAITDIGTAETDTALETSTQPGDLSTTPGATAESDTALDTTEECICEPETTTTTAPVCVCPPEAVSNEKELMSATEAAVGTLMMHREAKFASASSETTTTIMLDSTTATEVALSSTSSDSTTDVSLSSS